MSSVRSEIQVLNTGISREEYMQVSASIIKRLRIPTQRPLTLSFGSLNLQMLVSPITRSRKKNIIRLTEQTAEKLGLTEGDIIRISYRSSTRTIRLGPIVGVLMPAANDHPNRPFGNVTSFCKELHNAGRLYGGLVYFFTPDDISSSGVYGIRYAYQRFKRMTFPVPDVVYNRLTSRKLENKDSVQHFFRQVKSRYNGHVFNEKFLDKNEVFSALHNDSSVRRHLPESHLFTNFEQLNKMSKRYGSVFLKPVTGSLGKGIIRVSSSGAQVLCQHNSLTGTTSKKYPSLKKAFPTIRSKVRGKRYLIQQGLKLITVQKRPVDFRALVQRNETATWTITSIVGRIAGNQSFVSNIARGGTVCSARSALAQSNLPSHLQLPAYVKLKSAALQIAQSIESGIPYHFAELGIDLAVDESGKVWLLEVNSKPSKSDGTPLTTSKIRPSVKRVVQYSRSLTRM